MSNAPLAAGLKTWHAVREPEGLCARLFPAILKILLGQGKGVFAAGLKLHVPDDTASALGIRKFDVVMAGADAGQVQSLIRINAAVGIVSALVGTRLELPAGAR